MLGFHVLLKKGIAGRNVRPRQQTPEKSMQLHSKNSGPKTIRKKTLLALDIYYRYLHGPFGKGSSQVKTPILVERHRFHGTRVQKKKVEDLCLGFKGLGL